MSSVRREVELNAPRGIADDGKVDGVDCRALRGIESVGVMLSGDNVDLDHLRWK